jgi:hypothetical protein
MRTETVIRTGTCIALAIALAGCSTSFGAGDVPAAGLGPAASAPLAAPACPPVGKVIKQSKATAKNVLLKTTTGSGQVKAVWQITFANLTESESYPQYTAVTLGYCGSGAKPRGTLGGGGSYEHHRQCTNGVCTVTETVGVYYKPPATLQRNVFKFDTIRFAPLKPVKGYDPMIGVLVQVNKS